MPKSLKIVLNVIFYTVVALLIIMAAMYTVTALNRDVNHGLPTFFGKVMQTVESKSMEPEIMEGDLIISDEYTNQELKVGDIVSFNSFSEDMKEIIVVTHKIVKVEDAEKGLFITQGTYEYVSVDDWQYVATGDILAVYTGTRIPKLGSAMAFIQTRNGFFFCVLIPLVLFMVFQLYQFVATLMKIKEKNMKANIGQEAEALAMKKLREMQAQQGNNQEPPQGDPAETSSEQNE